MPIDYLADRPQLGVDTECYPNLWAIGFMGFPDRSKVVQLYITPDKPELDRQRIARILRNHRFYTFNGINYDLCMIAYAMAGASCEELKRANDDIIVAGMRYWEFFDHYGVTLPDFVDHIDLMEVLPSAAQRWSLKKYAGSMHSDEMRELPYSPDTWLDDYQIDQVLDYHRNDLHVTCDAAEEMQERVKIRAFISTQIFTDVRSKSDAQVGEAVMRYHVEKRTGKKVYKPDIMPGVFNFEAPRYVEFQTEPMQQMLSRLLRAPFVVKSDGYVKLPEIFGAKKALDDEDDYELEGGAEIVLDGKIYKMGIGGLHSQEKSVSYFEDDEFLLIDRDVTSYYPNLILRSGREPANMRGHFLHVYQMRVDARTAAKRIDPKGSAAEGGKIEVNGLFGKTGSPYSIVYSPQMMIQTTVPGQLSILMLIEECVLNGWEVVTANTDGFVTRVPRSEYGKFCAVIFDWECATGLQTEETRYRSIHARDVNNYVAFEKKKDGSLKAKRKGAFGLSGRGQPASMGLKKTPDVEICYDAVVAYLEKGTPIEETIRNCQDIRKFVRVRQVKGGAMMDDQYIAKAVRFYYSDDPDGALTYKLSGNKVSKSAGAKLCMKLPKELPRDIDYEYYEREAYAILDECGMEAKDPTTAGRSGHYYGRLDEQKTVHLVDAATGIGLCGATRKSRRDLWIESKTFDAALSGGYRYCAKCRRTQEL